MDFYQNIAYNSTPGKINTLLKKYNLGPIQNQAEAEHELKVLVKENGELGLYDVANLHPDKEVILKSTKHFAADGNCPLKKSGHSSCDGCSGADGDGKAPTRPSVQIKEYLNKNAGTLAALAIVVGVVALVVKGKI